MEAIGKFVDNQKNFSFIVMGVIAFVGFIIKIVLGANPSTDGIDGPASSTVYGFGIIAFSILCGIFLSFSLATEHIDNNKITDVLKLLITHSLQPILLFIILIWIISINANYYTKINKGQVTDSFVNFSSLSTLTITVQTIILFLFLNEKDVDRKNKMTQLLYILSSFNFVLVIIMNIIAKYFTTDG